MARTGHAEIFAAPHLVMDRLYRRADAWWGQSSLRFGTLSDTPRLANLQRNAGHPFFFLIFARWSPGSRFVKRRL